MVALMALTRSLMERRPMPGAAGVGDGAEVGEGAVGVVAAVWAMVSVVCAAGAC